MDPDRFGYISLHYVARLDPDRLKLTEYKRFEKCKFEIQIRSILQHAWAEIEHDLGYKGKTAIPRDIRRRFSRLAGLLEIADTEFLQIRESLASYEISVAQQIVKQPSEVFIDQASLNSYVLSSEIVKRTDVAIASVMEARLDYSIEWIKDLLHQVKFSGMNTIAQLDYELRQKAPIIPKFAEAWIDGKRESVNKGISIFYLVYVLIASTKSEKKALEYLSNFNLGTHESRKYNSERMGEILSQISE